MSVGGMRDIMAMNLTLVERKERDAQFIREFVESEGNATAAARAIGSSEASAGTTGWRMRERLSTEIIQYCQDYFLQNHSSPTNYAPAENLESGAIKEEVKENKESRRKDTKRKYDVEYRKRLYVIEKAKKRSETGVFKEYRKRPEVKARLYSYVRTKEYRERGRKRASNPEVKEKTRWACIMRNYGLCKEDFEMMLVEQKNKCIICGFEFTEESKSTRPHVDHCHDSGEVRGLLCGNCNAGLGQFKDDTQKLQSAIEYLT